MHDRTVDGRSDLTEILDELAANNLLTWQLLESLLVLDGTEDQES